MEFEVRHHFPVDPASLWESLYSPEYERYNAERTGLPRELLTDEIREGRRYRRHRIEAQHELPALVARAVGAARLVYDLEEHFDAVELKVEWRVVPSVAADKVDATGTYEVLPAEGGCERLVKGAIKVAIPLIGGKIERAIGDELKDSYEKNYHFVRSWLAERA